jgi:hypothetical protein
VVVTVSYRCPASLGWTRPDPTEDVGPDLGAGAPFGPWLEQLVRDHWPLPLAAQLAVVAGGFLWAPGVAFGITLPFLLLPGGRLRSPGWRVVVVTAVTGAGIVLVAGSLLPGRLGETSVANPFALAGTAGTVATVLFDAGLVLHAGSAVAALVSLVLRFRSSRGVERQQLRWVAAGGAAALAGLLPTILVGLGIAPRVNDVVVYPAVLCVPVTVAVAVLRYRLWDLDGLVSRTVTYALVTGRLAAGTGSLGVAAATLAAAAAFAPLRRRVQALVDRRFNRRRYDAARTVEAFTARLREQVDLDALRAELPGRGRPDCAADPGVAVAAPTGGHTTNPVTALPPGPSIRRPAASEPTAPWRTRAAGRRPS